MTIQPGNFEVVLLKGKELWHYTKDNSQPHSSWKATACITKKATSSGCIIEGPFGFEVVVVEDSNSKQGNSLVHYHRDKAGIQWQLQGIITDQATGSGCILESRDKYTFEVVVLEGSRLVHYWKDISSNKWNRGEIITDSATNSGWIIQSNINRSSNYKYDGNFEVVVQEGDQLVHYWKEDSDPSSAWKRGQVISARAQDSGCIIQSSFGQASDNEYGNFEVIVLEPEGLIHYWHSNKSFSFNHEYNPSGLVDVPYPKHDVDFTYRGAYSLYNWELFLHIPILVADRLSKNQRFAEAQRWFHYVFNPTTDSGETTIRRFWNVLPLRGIECQRLDHMLAILQKKQKNSPEQKQLLEQIEQWLKYPFQPHRIARMRLIAYQKYVVMKSGLFHSKNGLEGI